MSACLMVGAAMLALTNPEFRLSWTHSVEKVEWVETYAVEPDALRLIRAAVKGSGAGMEPGEDAILSDGWWEWVPGTVAPELYLAASGATISAWQLCIDGQCRDVAAEPGDALRIAPCRNG